MSLQARDAQVAQREAFEKFMEKYGGLPGAGDCGKGVNHRLSGKGRKRDTKPAANCSKPQVENRAVNKDIRTDTKSVPLVSCCNACAGTVKCVEAWPPRPRAHLCCHCRNLVPAAFRRPSHICLFIWGPNCCWNRPSAGADAWPSEGVPKPSCTKAQ
eukprot:365925-Chlamydomonas_euryale.AAC.8